MSLPPGTGFAKYRYFFSSRLGVQSVFPCTFRLNDHKFSVTFSNVAVPSSNETHSFSFSVALSCMNLDQVEHSEKALVKETAGDFFQEPAILEAA